MNVLTRCRTLLTSVLALGTLALAAPAWAAVGSGTLTVTDDGLCSGSGFENFDSPNHWDVLQGQTVHLSINASFRVCTSSPPQFLGKICTSDSQCGTPQNTGTCSSTNQLECSGSTTVFVKGKSGVPCSMVDQPTGDADCALAAQTDPSLTTCDISSGFCKFVDQISATSDGDSIDVCYTTRSDQCQTAAVAYCDIGNEANTIIGQQTQVAVATDLRAVDPGPAGSCVSGICSNDSNGTGAGACTTDADCDTPIESCLTFGIPDCTNQVGSLCCGLTQGAYGATNSVATAFPNSDCSASGLGFIPAAVCQGFDVFNSGSTDPNALGVAQNGTTIGIFGTRSVTVLDLQTLIAYLPASGTAGKLASGTPNDKQYSAGLITPPASNVSGSGSKGNGAGVLAGQTMACQLNDFLSDSGFAPSGFGGFTLPSAGTLVCTKRSGTDKVLGTGDDVCQAFSYPSCVAGLTVQQVIEKANAFLAGSTTTGCTASDLNNALSNFNVQFDQCGNVIACESDNGNDPNLPVTTAGVFTCPSP